MSGKLWACSMSGRVDVELSLRNKGVKAVAYKHSASIVAAGVGSPSPTEKPSFKVMIKQFIPASSRN